MQPNAVRYNNYQENYIDMAPSNLLSSPRGGFASPTKRIPPSLVRRIRAAYVLAISHDDDQRSPVWSIMESSKRDVHDALINGDDKLLANMLGRSRLK